MKKLLIILFAFVAQHVYAQSPVSIQAIIGGQSYDFGSVYELPDSILRQPFQISVLNLNPENGMVYCFRSFNMILNTGIGPGKTIKMPNNQKITKQSDCTYTMSTAGSLSAKQDIKMVLEDVYVMNASGKKKVLNLSERSRYINLKGI